MLVLNNIEIVYSDVILALKGVSLQVPDGNSVALLGANGAGKSTVLKGITGLLEVELGEITSGTAEYQGVLLNKKNPADIVKMGIVLVPQERAIFEHLNVEQNLMLGAYARRNNVKEEIAKVYDYFPKLSELKHNASGYLSGGERQMMVIGRALMARPDLMLLDEPSLGLAPLLTAKIFEIIKRLNEEQNLSILLVEQNVEAALAITSYGYVMENGKTVLDGPTEKLKENRDIQEFYLGLSELGKRKSYREVKHYKRRRRWVG